MIKLKKMFSYGYIALFVLLSVAAFFAGTVSWGVAFANEQESTEAVEEGIEASDTYANDTAEYQTVSGTETPAEDTAEDPTFFGRIWEWITTNANGILTVIGDIVLVVCLIYQRIKSKKKLVELGDNIVTVKGDVSDTINVQKSVVNVTNELIEGYNRFEKALNNFDTTENERYKIMLAAFAQTKAILEILTTVYANSKNIPQGVKDLVNLKYADVLKLVSDEEKLKNIAAPVAEAGENTETVVDSVEV